MNYPDIIPITEGPMGYGISPFDNCQAGYVLYQCPGCGRTSKHALISQYMPNTTCTCNFPTCVYIMNVIGSWKHPNWIEFEERSYWEEKGVITDAPYIPCPVKTEEELWLEMVRKNLPQAPSNGCALSVKVTTGGKLQYSITRILNTLLGSERHLQK